MLFIIIFHNIVKNFIGNNFFIKFQKKIPEIV